MGWTRDLDMSSLLLASTLSSTIPLCILLEDLFHNSSHQFDEF